MKYLLLPFLALQTFIGGSKPEMRADIWYENAISHPSEIFEGKDAVAARARRAAHLRDVADDGQLLRLRKAPNGPAVLLLSDYAGPSI